MADYKPKEVYKQAMEIGKKVERETSEAQQVMTSMYMDAARELGYSSNELHHNKDKAREAMRLALSDKYMCNEEKNSLLNKHPLMKNYKDAESYEKEQILSLVFGMNSASWDRVIDDRGLNLFTFAQYMSQVVESQQNSAIDSYLQMEIGDDREKLAELAGLDQYIDNIDTRRLDREELREVVRDSVLGKHSYESLEHKVGVEVKKLAA